MKKNVSLALIAAVAVVVPSAIAFAPPSAALAKATTASDRFLPTFGSKLYMSDGNDDVSVW